MGKAEAVFDKVFSTVNKLKATTSGELPEMKAILLEAGHTAAEWYPALAWARKRAPETYAMFYKALGKDPPARRGGAEEPDEDAGVDEAAETAPTSATAADALSNCISWIESAPEDARSRILRALGVYFEETA